MRTIIGFFDHKSQADDALAALEQAGFARSDISVLAHDPRAETETPAVGPVHSVGADTEAGRDAAIGGIAGTVAGLVLAVIPGIGPLAAVGPITGAIGGLGIGAAAGAVIGAFKDMGVSEEDAEYYAEGIRRGGTMVSVRCQDAEAGRVESIMQDYGALDIQERARQWRETGWTGYDPDAEPYPRVRRA